VDVSGFEFPWRRDGSSESPVPRSEVPTLRSPTRAEDQTASERGGAKRVMSEPDVACGNLAPRLTCAKAAIRIPTLRCSSHSKTVQRASVTGVRIPPLRQMDMKQPRSPKRWPGLLALPGGLHAWVVRLVVRPPSAPRTSSSSAASTSEELQDQDDDRNDDQDVDQAAERVASHETEQP
jgi:hypothetical protein